MYHRIQYYKIIASVTPNPDLPDSCRPPLVTVSKVRSTVTSAGEDPTYMLRLVVVDSRAYGCF